MIHRLPALALALLLLLPAAAPAEAPNDFYDNEPTVVLAGPAAVELAGELESPGVADLAAYPRRSLVVRETSLAGGAIAFVGAYRYDGVSLLDLLRDRMVRKAPGDGFDSNIDLLVAVENDRGERVVLSWGEIVYPAAPDRILIARAVSRIVPSKTGERFPLPGETRLVCGNDLATVRNLARPSRITVFSAPVALAQRKGMPDLRSESFVVTGGNAPGGARFARIPAGLERRRMPSVFFGRGRGFHGHEVFTGVLFADALRPHVPVDRDALMKAYLVVCAKDGYRVAIAASELFNRNDQCEFLLRDLGPGAEGGRFALFPPVDFFSDRAVKAIESVRLFRLP